MLRAIARIDEYLAHRALREEQILSLLAEEPCSVGELVEQIYVAYPVEVYPLAERTVSAHLQKLEREGRIDVVSGQTPVRYRVGRPQACERCGRPVRGAARLCGACAVSSLQEPG